MSASTIASTVVLGRAARRAAGLGWPVRISAGFLVLLAVVAVAAPLVAPHDPQATDLSAVYQGPSASHWLGTDEVGRDIASRLIWAARVSIVPPLLIVLVASLLGVTIAVAAAWRGGRFDSFVTAVLDVMLGFPGLLIALLAVGTFGVGLLAPSIALVIAYTPYFARVIRSVAIRERTQTYVRALTTQGFSAWRIAGRHIVPNIFPLVMAQGALFFAYAMVDLAAISYLGIGVQPPTADWGSMVGAGQNGILEGSPQGALSAGLAIVLTVVALNVVGEGLAERAGGGRP